MAEGPNGGPRLVPQRVSVVVPTRNSGRTIGRLLDSVATQDYDERELIVVDNHSTDQTAALARSKADIFVSAGPERSAQRNIGARQASGEYVVFIDSDMILLPGLLRDIAGTFAANPELAALVLPERSVGQGFWAKCRTLEKELSIGDPAVEAARAFRHDAFLRVDGYDEALNGPEDWDLPERLAASGGLIGRTSVGLLHDEGSLRLGAILQKKFYYGHTFSRYVKRSPSNAARRIRRKSLVRLPGRVTSHPVLVPALVILKALEFVALVLGMVDFAFRERRTSRRRVSRPQ